MSELSEGSNWVISLLLCLKICKDTPINYFQRKLSFTWIFFFSLLLKFHSKVILDSLMVNNCPLNVFIKKSNYVPCILKMWNFFFYRDLKSVSYLWVQKYSDSGLGPYNLSNCLKNSIMPVWILKKKRGDKTRSSYATGKYCWSPLPLSVNFRTHNYCKI